MGDWLSAPISLDSVRIPMIPWTQVLCHLQLVLAVEIGRCVLVSETHHGALITKAAPTLW